MDWALGTHDVEFSGFRPYHFSMRQMTRLLLLRGEILDASLGIGRFTDDVAMCYDTLAGAA